MTIERNPLGDRQLGQPVEEQAYGFRAGFTDGDGTAWIVGWLIREVPLGNLAFAFALDATPDGALLGDVEYTQLTLEFRPSGAGTNPIDGRVWLPCGFVQIQSPTAVRAYDVIDGVWTRASAADVTEDHIPNDYNGQLIRKTRANLSTNGGKFRCAFTHAASRKLWVFFSDVQGTGVSSVNNPDYGYSFTIDDDGNPDIDSREFLFDLRSNNPVNPLYDPTGAFVIGDTVWLIGSSTGSVPVRVIAAYDISADGTLTRNAPKDYQTAVALDEIPPVAFTKDNFIWGITQTFTRGFGYVTEPGNLSMNVWLGGLQARFNETSTIRMSFSVRVGAPSFRASLGSISVQLTVTLGRPSIRFGLATTLRPSRPMYPRSRHTVTFLTSVVGKFVPWAPQDIDRINLRHPSTPSWGIVGSINNQFEAVVDNIATQGEPYLRYLSQYRNWPIAMYNRHAIHHVSGQEFFAFGGIVGFLRHVEVLPSARTRFGAGSSGGTRDGADIVVITWSTLPDPGPIIQDIRVGVIFNRTPVTDFYAITSPDRIDSDGILQRRPRELNLEGGNVPLVTDPQPPTIVRANMTVLRSTYDDEVQTIDGDILVDQNHVVECVVDYQGNILPAIGAEAQTQNETFILQQVRRRSQQQVFMRLQRALSSAGSPSLLQQELRQLEAG